MSICLLSFDLIAMPFVFVLARNCNQMQMPCLIGFSKGRGNRKLEIRKQGRRNVRKEDWRERLPDCAGCVNEVLLSVGPRM
jgi:hypothetical protein